MKSTFFRGAMFFCLVAAFMSSAQALAGDSDFLPINPAPKVYSPEAIKQNKVEARGIPYFNGRGVIMDIRGNRIVISDLDYGFCDDVDYRSEASGQPLPPSEFLPGVRIGFVLDEENCIASLWLLKEQ